MQKDFRKHHREDDFILKIIENNKDIYPTGVTGYEPFYVDLEGFWRQLYYPADEKEEMIKKYDKKISVAKDEYFLANEEKLNVFREKSFEIAKRYSSEIIKQKWKTLIKEKTD